MPNIYKRQVVPELFTKSKAIVMLSGIRSNVNKNLKILRNP